MDSAPFSVKNSVNLTYFLKVLDSYYDYDFCSPLVRRRRNQWFEIMPILSSQGVKKNNLPISYIIIYCV